MPGKKTPSVFRGQGRKFHGGSDGWRIISNDETHKVRDMGMEMRNYLKG